jgi:D-3-phosphoglycerate dehydrogenase
VRFDRQTLRSQRLRDVNFQGDALRMGMNWTEEDLGEPQILVDSAYDMGHPGAAIDDLEEEPAKHHDWRPENPLLHMENVIVTPHAAYYSEESIRLVRTIAANEVVRVLTGQSPRSPVNVVEQPERDSA